MSITTSDKTRMLAEQLRGKFGALLSEIAEFRRECTLIVHEKARIAEVCSYAKKELGFDGLTDLSSVDNYGEDPRFWVVYELYGHEHHAYLRLKTRVGEEDCHLPSVTCVWRTANWHEREIYDMMGIRFDGHPDLRRILMWEGYPYYPLRKDFPLEGKETELPDVAFTQKAPLEGGPFVTTTGEKNASSREPRARTEENR
ncbi:MAG: NADH-quinone oxidoreductase subunit C [Verrucomicrobiota bacterium]|jgi:NADH-quinone oxidoreductase subunit C|nr:NADH-quinone oxidoreductase subunit C [Verrucomicrobiota bacterium]MDG1893141.1 NADH-quinone oxidoreductase subunit C [Verrucomicrobiota bacterium]